MGSASRRGIACRSRFIHSHTAIELGRIDFVEIFVSTVLACAGAIFWLAFQRPTAFRRLRFLLVVPLGVALCIVVGFNLGFAVGRHYADQAIIGDLCAILGVGIAVIFSALQLAMVLSDGQGNENN